VFGLSSQEGKKIVLEAQDREYEVQMKCSRRENQVARSARGGMRDEEFLRAPSRRYSSWLGRQRGCGTDQLLCSDNHHRPQQSLKIRPLCCARRHNVGPSCSITSCSFIFTSIYRGQPDRQALEALCPRGCFLYALGPACKALAMQVYCAGR
jgi:hypothetical protein